jgi:hypothetical protein
MSETLKKSSMLKLLLGALLVVAMVLMFSSQSYADSTTATTTATITINGGPRTISANTGTVTLPAVPLNGSQQTKTAALGNINVVDASGTGNGWDVTVQATPVKAGSQSLGTGHLSIEPVKSVAKVDPTSSNVPASKLSSNKVIDTGAVTVLSANTGDGMGSYQASLGNVILSIPASTYAGTYTATITYSLVTAP